MLVKGGHGDYNECMADINFINSIQKICTFEQSLRLSKHIYDQTGNSEILEMEKSIYPKISCGHVSACL